MHKFVLDIAYPMIFFLKVSIAKPLMIKMILRIVDSRKPTDMYYGKIPITVLSTTMTMMTLRINGLGRIKKYKRMVNRVNFLIINHIKYTIVG